MRISDWSSDVCSSDLLRALQAERAAIPDSNGHRIAELESALVEADAWSAPSRAEQLLAGLGLDRKSVVEGKSGDVRVDLGGRRSLKKNKKHTTDHTQTAYRGIEKTTYEVRI